MRECCFILGIILVHQRVLPNSQWGEKKRKRFALVLTGLCKFAYIFSEQGEHKLNQKHSRCLYRVEVAIPSVGTKKKKEKLCWHGQPFPCLIIAMLMSCHFRGGWMEQTSAADKINSATPNILSHAHTVLKACVKMQISLPIFHPNKLKNLPVGLDNVSVLTRRNIEFKKKKRSLFE